MQKNEWIYSFRMRASIRTLGLLGTALTVAMTGLSFFAWFAQPANDPVDPVKMPFVISGFLSFVALYVYLLLLYHRYRLFVGESVIRQTGILLVKQADLSKINELRWCCFPRGGSIRLTENSGVLKIDLGNLEKEDRVRLIDFLRLFIGESKQIGWQQFKDQFADTSTRQKYSNRVQLMFAFIFGAHAVAFGTIWAIGGGIQFLLYSAVNVVVTLYLLRKRPLKDGQS